ncbi:MAG TPA: hypothetical protein H9742_14240 [Candidatus Acetatifactor stercoripullorum]|uniref:Uncharacterized protein n=1 Tax=Candidatus Acetatifactor stercoripullorum TaxID=2838414 RepID=A0A9D1R6K7_9FIRM|nr:hypothetical protein [Candidatus Acetatifactor stercoripullorum]
MDLKIRILQKTIEKLLWESGLPAEVRRLVLSDLQAQAGREADAAVDEQMKEERREKQDAEGLH